MDRACGVPLISGGRPMTAEQPLVGPGGIGGGDAIAVHFGAGTPPMLWLVILTSVTAVMFVVVAGLDVGPLFPGADSRTAGSSSTTLPSTVKLCADGSVHDTVQENNTGVATDIASDHRRCHARQPSDHGGIEDLLHPTRDGVRKGSPGVVRKSAERGLPVRRGWPCRHDQHSHREPPDRGGAVTTGTL